MIREVVLRLVWFTLSAGVLSYATALIVGSYVYASVAEPQHVVLRDVIERGAHHMSGMVTVHSDCDELSVKSNQEDADNYTLAFATWEQPYRDCPPERVPRSFRAIVFAPSAGVSFHATLDGKKLPLKIIPVASTTQK